jgi:hypothetical protein
MHASLGPVKLPIYTILAMSQVSYKKEQKLPWLPKTEILKLDSQDFQIMHMTLFCRKRVKINLYCLKMTLTEVEINCKYIYSSFHSNNLF